MKLNEYLENILLLEEKQTKAEKNKIKKVMKEWKAGTLKSSSGEVVKDQKQALAIAYSYFKKKKKHGKKKKKEK